MNVEIEFDGIMYFLKSEGKYISIDQNSPILSFLYEKDAKEAKKRIEEKYGKRA